MIELPIDQGIHLNWGFSTNSELDHNFTFTFCSYFALWPLWLFPVEMPKLIITKIEDVEIKKK